MKDSIYWSIIRHVGSLKMIIVDVTCLAEVVGGYVLGRSHSYWTRKIISLDHY